MSMFCFQCQETAKGTGCAVKGVCGKQPTTSRLMDLLIFNLEGLAVLEEKATARREIDPEVGRFLLEGLFTTITNVTFDDARVGAQIERALTRKKKLLDEVGDDGSLPEAATWVGGPETFAAKAESVGILAEANEDIRSLKELMMYGLKGVAAYADHAAVLGFEDAGIYRFAVKALAAMTKDLSADELTGLVLQTGEVAVTTMALLDKANTSTYGQPELTKVNIGVRSNPGILISGHDLRDMAELLEQTAGSRVDVYTHGEMLPAHYYPAFKKYPHFAGNYGNAWWKQDKEFASFNGPILMTTNCIVPVKEGYKERIFTTGLVGYPGVKHIADRKPGGQKDFSEIIALAKTCPAPTELEQGEIVGGFAHQQVFALADKVVEAVKSGAIKRFVVMAGCDGRGRPGAAQGHGHPHRGLREVPLQQAAARRHRRHPAGARRRPVQRQLLAGAHRPEAQGGLRAEGRQRAAALLRHRLVRAEGGSGAPRAAAPGRQGHPPRAHAPRVPVAERGQGARREVRHQADHDREGGRAGDDGRRLVAGWSRGERGLGGFNRPARSSCGRAAEGRSSSYRSLGAAARSSSRPEPPGLGRYAGRSEGPCDRSMGPAAIRDALAEFEGDVRGQRPPLVRILGNAGFGSTCPWGSIRSAHRSLRG